MEYIAVFYFCVGIFVLSVCGDQCLFDGTQCIQKISSADLKNVPLLCKILNKTSDCIDDAMAKCTTEEARVKLNITKLVPEQQKATHCKEAQPAESGAVSSSDWPVAVCLISMLVFGCFMYV